MKKKERLRILLAICLVVVLVCACGKQDSEEKKITYEGAIEYLEETGLEEDGSYQISEELLIALSNTEYTEPKNFIFMIGDGMGFNIVEATQTAYAEHLYEGTLAMNYMPVQSSQTTYSTSDQVTDSAAGATAFATGYKTANQVISMDPEGVTSYKTILELAAEKGKSTGLVATEAITEATPAVFASHVGIRSSESDIAAMQLEKFVDGSLDLVLGGGSIYYQMATNAEIMSAAQTQGMTFATDWATAKEASLPLAGLFAQDNMNTVKDEEPTIAQMTDLALNLLGEDENGFFLMVEGSQIDNYAEYNVFDETAKNLYDFDCAIAVAMRYVALHPDTVLIITADHETGGVTLPEELAKDKLGDDIFTTRKHTYETVPVYAAGYGTEALSNINENVDLGILVASLMGEVDFGLSSTIHNLKDTMEETAFNADKSGFVVPLTDIAEACSNIQYARAIHVTVKNAGEKVATLPILKFTLAGTEYSVEPQRDSLAVDETITLSYVLPVEAWEAGKLKEIEEFIFSVEGSEVALEFSNMCLTEREPQK